MKITWPEFLKVPINLWNVWPSQYMKKVNREINNEIQKPPGCTSKT